MSKPTMCNKETPAKLTHCCPNNQFWYFFLINVAVDKHYIKVLYSFGTVEGDANGFLMYIGEPAEFPTLQVMDKNVLL